MPPSALTYNYDALYSTTIANYHRTLMDGISTSNLFLYTVMKKNDTYRAEPDPGLFMQLPIMYQLGGADSYDGYDILDVTPMDGITSAFYDWRQCAVQITISGKEEKQNSGEARIISLLESKTKQAEMGIQEFFNKALLQGNGINAATQITTPYNSAINNSTFLDPMPLQIKFDPTSSTTVGGINQATYTWWRNQFKNDASTTYQGFLKNLRNLRNNCSKGPGGKPDIHIVDQATYELYEAALSSFHRNPDYQKADIPFDALAFYGSPVVWDEFVSNVSGGTTVQSTTQGTWYMINSKFWMIKYHPDANFTPTPFIKPENQDARTSHLLWFGSSGCTNRRKQGVMGDIDTTIAA